jgi:hypothetical protein
MTLHYQITKAIHKRDTVRLCVNCYRVGLTTSDMTHFEIPPQYMHLVTGTVCDSCFDDWQESVKLRKSNIEKLRE